MDAVMTFGRILPDIPSEPVIERTGSGPTPVLIIAVVAAAAILIWRFYGKKKQA